MALVTVAEIIKFAFKNEETIDSDYFTDDYIETVELVHLRTYFPDVYDIIVEKNGSGLTTNETELVTRIKHPLALFCKHDIVPEVSLQLGNAGAQAFSSDYSAPVSSTARASLQGTIMTHAEALMSNVMRWYITQDDLTTEETQPSLNNTGDIIF